MDEVWRAISGYEGIYEVSDFGQVRSLDRIIALRPSRTRKVRAFTQQLRGRVMKQYNAPNGYMTVVLKAGDVGRTHSVHRLVCQAFHGEPGTPKHVNHIDGNKTNNRADNLQWVSPIENIAHAHAANLMNPARGEQAGGAKLTEPEVREIKRLLSEGMSQRKIAAIYGIGQRTVGNINTGERWVHVT